MRKNCKRTVPPPTRSDKEAVQKAIDEALQEAASMGLIVDTSERKYVHPRVGNAGEGGREEDFVPLAERLAAYQRRDDMAAAPRNVARGLTGYEVE